MKRRKGHQVEYQGKKYDSLSELSKDLELPYSSIVHNYYRTKNVDKAVKIAQKAKEAEIYVVWGKKYCSVSKMANEYGISPATISKKLKQGKTVEEALAEILKKEVIFFQGKEILGLTELSCYYGQDVSLIWERLSNGMNLEEALFSPIRRRNKPQCKIEYYGITYESKRDFSRKMKISVGYGTNVNWKCKGYLYKKQEKCRDRTITDDQIKQVRVDAINAAIQNQGLLYKKDPEDVISPEYRRMDRKIAEMKGKAVSEKEFIQALYQRAEERYRTLTVKDALYKTEEIRDILAGREKIVEFDRELYKKLIRKIYLCNGNMAEVEFLNGGRMKVGYTDKKLGKEANGYNS